MGAAERSQAWSEAVTVPGLILLTCRNVPGQQLRQVVRSVRIEVHDLSGQECLDDGNERRAIRPAVFVVIAASASGGGAQPNMSAIAARTPSSDQELLASQASAQRWGRAGLGMLMAELACPAAGCG